MHSYVLDMYWSLRKTLLTMGSIIRGLSYLHIFYHPRFGDCQLHTRNGQVFAIGNGSHE